MLKALTPAQVLLGGGRTVRDTASGGKLNHEVVRLELVHSGARHLQDLGLITEPPESPLVHLPREVLTSFLVGRL